MLDAGVQRQSRSTTKRTSPRGDQSGGSSGRTTDQEGQGRDLTSKVAKEGSRQKSTESSESGGAGRGTVVELDIVR